MGRGGREGEGRVGGVGVGIGEGRKRVRGMYGRREEWEEREGEGMWDDGGGTKGVRGLSGLRRVMIREKEKSGRNRERGRGRGGGQKEGGGVGVRGMYGVKRQMMRGRRKVEGIGRGGRKGVEKEEGLYEKLEWRREREQRRRNR